MAVLQFGACTKQIESSTFLMRLRYGCSFAIYVVREFGEYETSSCKEGSSAFLSAEKEFYDIHSSVGPRTVDTAGQSLLFS